MLNKKFPHEILKAPPKMLVSLFYKISNLSTQIIVFGIQ